MGNLLSTLEKRIKESNEKFIDLQQKAENKLFEQLNGIISKNDEIEEFQTQLKKLKDIGRKLMDDGDFTQALTLFKETSDFLLEEGRKREAVYFSLQFNKLRGLLIERKEKIDELREARSKNNQIEILRLFPTIINLSKQLKDDEAVNRYESEFIDFKENININRKNLLAERIKLAKKAIILEKQGLFKDAAILYQKAEKISSVLSIMGYENDSNITKFKKKKEDCRKKSNYSAP
ncbi:MAG: hypothetical protein GF329_09190 [Candidatus Lokiarchaeota archaeon]|nr:hypothetical protein [Candidatus Lokiarchaeota archaeon]